MAKSGDAWGIEVGANAIKAMRLVRQGEQIVLGAYDVIPFKRVLTAGDIDVEEAVQVNLDKLMSRHAINRSNVLVSIRQHAFARFATLPPVEPKRINDIVKFEAVQQIPFPIDQVEWDYQLFQDPDSPDAQVGIFAITKQHIAEYLSNYRAVGMQVDAVTLSSLALYNAVAYDQELTGEDGLIIMDIGASSTDLIIVHAGSVWVRSLPIGGNNFTEALVRQFKLSFPKAERLKREAGTSKYARQIFQAMRPVFTDLVQEMQRSLGYYQSINRDADLDRLIGFGSTFRLPGLQKFLKQQLQLEIIRPDGFNRLSAAGAAAGEFANHALNMGTAYGLALQGLDEERINCNLVPTSVVKQRVWRAKQPLMAIVAAVILVTSILSYSQYTVQSRRLNETMQATEAVADPVINRARGLKSEMDEVLKQNDPRQRINNMRRVLDYRDLWPKLLDDLNRVAVAMEPDPVVHGANYEEILRLPRQSRRRVYLDSMVAQYQFAPTNAPTLPGQIWGEADNVISVDTAGQQTGGGEEAGGRNVETPMEPPRFTIKLSGLTPHSDGATFLDETFIAWLRDEANADREDRPYVIRTGERDTLETLRRVTSRPPAATNELYPVRPTDQEQAADYRFDISYSVELVRPDEARKSEDEGRRTLGRGDFRARDEEAGL